MILGIIIACEIGFWVLIVLGLGARYVLRRPRLGAVLLALTPVIDLVLLLAAGWDLSRGADAVFAHALAAVYLGFSVVYGRRMIRWADVRFAHRFAGGPAPVRLDGGDYARACWADVVRTAAAAAIAAGVLWLLASLSTDGTDVSALTGMYRVLGIVLAIEVIWAASYTVWPRRPRVPESARTVP